MLHSTHIGISYMKNLAQQYVWWPKIDCNVEAKVKGCSTCEGSGPCKSILHPWEWPKSHGLEYILITLAGKCFY